MINTATDSKSGIPTRFIYDLGIEQSLLSYWVNTGLISPSIRKGKPGDPKSSTALWSFNDLVEIQTIQYLRKHGVSLQKVRTVLKRIREKNYPLNATNLVTDGHEVLINLDCKVIEVLGDTDQFVLFKWKEMIKNCIKAARKKS